jgi:hypothetical protein
MAVWPAETKGSTAVAAAAASLLAVAAILAGCNLQHVPATPQNPPRLSSDAGFFFNNNGDSAGLAYGMANSDAVDLMLECEKGARSVQVIDAAHPGARKDQPITLISDGARSDLPTRVDLDEERGQALSSGRTATDSPVLTAFRRSGRMTVKLGARERSYAATRGELVSVARFFAVCEGK